MLNPADTGGTSGPALPPISVPNASPLVLLVRLSLAGSLAELHTSPIRVGCWSIDSTEKWTDSFASYRDGVCLWRLLQQQLVGMRGLSSLRGEFGRS